MRNDDQRKPDMKKPELNPCPMCGGTNIVIESNGIGEYYVVCGTGEEDGGGCGLQTDDRHCETKAHAAERWNRRTIPEEHELPYTMTRVLKAIDSERVYQDAKWPGRRHTVGEWILIMEKCLNDARQAWVINSGDNVALHEIRQVVAVGVAAMEQCGSPLRESKPAERPAWAVKDQD